MVRNKFLIVREFHLQPDYIDQLPYYEYEWWLEDIKNYLKEQEKQRKKEEKAQNSNTSAAAMMRQARASMPSTPRMSIPKF